MHTHVCVRACMRTHIHKRRIKVTYEASKKSMKSLLQTQKSILLPTKRIFVLAIIQFPCITKTSLSKFHLTDTHKRFWYTKHIHPPGSLHQHVKRSLRRPTHAQFLLSSDCAVGTPQFYHQRNLL
jgi:hypothetical protein